MHATFFLNFALLVIRLKLISVTHAFHKESQLHSNNVMQNASKFSVFGKSLLYTLIINYWLPNGSK